MDELKQIATVLGSLGIKIESINFISSQVGGYDQAAQVRTIQPEIDKIFVVLNHRGKKIVRSYTIEDLRSSLIIDARTQPGEPHRADRLAKSVIGRILQK